MQITILADGRTFYRMDLVQLLRVEQLRGTAILMPASGELEVVVTIDHARGERTDQLLAGSEIRVFGVQPTLPTDELED